jgi:predicted dehydrogenase
VICEKPLARTSADAQRIADAAKAAKGMFMPAMCMRFWPQWAWLKQAVVEKRYGKVLSATFRRVSQMPSGWYGEGRISGGAALDLHIHDSDFVQFLFGMPKAVASRGYSRSSGEIDHLTTQYHYDDVPLVAAEGGWCLQDGYGFSMQYTVNFEKATAEYDLARGADSLKLTTGGKTQSVDAGRGFGYAAELRYFLGCISKGEKPSIVTADDGVRSLRLVEAEVQSVCSGLTVKL